MRLVAVPADPDTDVVFRREELLGPGRGAAEGLDLLDEVVAPFGDRFGLCQTPHVLS